METKRKKEEKEGVAVRMQSHCLDCQVPLSPSSVTRTSVSGQRAKEEGGGERELARVSVLLHCQAQQSQRQSDSQTRKHQSPLQGERESVRLSLLHYRAQQSQRQSDSQTRRHQSPLHSVWPESEGGRRRRERESAKLSALLHCRAQHQSPLPSV